MIKLPSIISVLALAIAGAGAIAEPPPSAFVYNGHLSGVSDDVDMKFTLWDGASGGSRMGPILRFDGSDQHPLPVPVVASNFGVSLDFGPDAFSTGAGRWLQVEYRVPHDPIDLAPYTAMSARQQIRSAALATVSQNTRGLTVDSSGRVGIGGTPSELLQLNGGNLWLNSENVGLIVGATSKSSGLMKYDSHEAGFWRGAATGFSIGRVNTNDVTTGTPLATPDLFINGSGNVGVGTETPGNKLTVAGSIGTMSGLVFPDGTTQTTAVEPSAIVNPSNGSVSLDQFQPAFDGPTVSMSNVWQSFQCAKTGRLTGISVTPAVNPTATIPVEISIYEGITPAGRLLGTYSATIPVGNRLAVGRMNFPVETSPAVNAGTRYVFKLTSTTAWNGSGSNTNQYGPGSCNDSPSYDLNFGTWVTQGYTKGSVTIAGDLKFSNFSGANSAFVYERTLGHGNYQIFSPNGFSDLPDSYTPSIDVPRGLAVLTWSTSAWTSVSPLKLSMRPFMRPLSGGGFQSLLGPPVVFYFNPINKHMVISGSAVFEMETGGAYQVGLQYRADTGGGMLDGNDFVSWTLTVYRY